MSSIWSVYCFVLNLQFILFLVEMHLSIRMVSSTNVPSTLMLEYQQCRPNKGMILKYCRSEPQSKILWKLKGFYHVTLQIADQNLIIPEIKNGFAAVSAHIMNKPLVPYLSNPCDTTTVEWWSINPNQKFEMLTISLKYFSGSYIRKLDMAGGIAILLYVCYLCFVLIRFWAYLFVLF